MAKFTLHEIVKLFGELGEVVKFSPTFNDDGMIFVQFQCGQLVSLD